MSLFIKKVRCDWLIVIMNREGLVCKESQWRMHITRVWTVNHWTTTHAAGSIAGYYFCTFWYCWLRLKLNIIPIHWLLLTHWKNKLCKLSLIVKAMEDSPVNSPEQSNFADINNNQDTKTTSDKSVDSPEGKSFLLFSSEKVDYRPGFRKAEF